MPLTSIDVERLRRNFDDGGSLAFQELIALLADRVAPGAWRARGELLDVLRRHRFRAYAADDSGHGPADPNPHVTVLANGRGFHLQLDLRRVVFRITDSNRNDLGGPPPWVAPGSEPPTRRR